MSRMALLARKFQPILIYYSMEVNVIYDGIKTYPIDIFINNGPYNLFVNGTHEFNQATIKRPNSPVVTLTASLSNWANINYG